MYWTKSTGNQFGFELVREFELFGFDWTNNKYTFGVQLGVTWWYNNNMYKWFYNL